MHVTGNLVWTWSSSQVHIICDKVILFILFFFFPKACFQYVEYSFEEYVFVLKCVCMRASVSACEKVIDIELTVKISRVQSKTV